MSIGNLLNKQTPLRPSTNLPRPYITKDMLVAIYCFLKNTPHEFDNVRQFTMKKLVCDIDDLLTIYKRVIDAEDAFNASCNSLMDNAQAQSTHVEGYVFPYTMMTTTTTCSRRTTMQKMQRKTRKRSRRKTKRRRKRSQKGFVVVFFCTQNSSNSMPSVLDKDTSFLEIKTVLAEILRVLVSMVLISGSNDHELQDGDPVAPNYIGKHDLRTGGKLLWRDAQPV